ncbi:TniQ family protein [Paraburkholderia sediminicola]|uniref:TniQ family protein n=1 Tax=Paraburkholderia sediminicola TaxID=458836 RepID=UPI0038B79038
MAVYLDEPLPDEILFSVIARYMQRARIESTRGFLTVLTGDRKGKGGDVDEFEQLADETYRVWEMSASEIRSRLTLAPFYSALFPGNGRIDALGRRVRCVPWSGYLAPGRPGVRYCEACWADDDRNGYPRYWRRIHQLPGVVVCAEHGQVLFGTGFSFSRDLLTTVTKHERGHPLVSDMSRELAKWGDLATFAKHLLNERCSWPQLGAQTSHLDLARKCGYVVGGKLDDERIANDLSTRFGTEYFGAVTSTHDISPELRRAISVSDERACAPLFALLAAYLLTDVGGRLMGSEGPDCPGSVSHQDENHRVLRWPDRQGRPHFLCSCGLSFVLDRSDSGASITPTQEGPDIALAAVMLVARSWPVQSLVSMLGVSRHAIETMIGRRVAVRPWRRRTERAKRLVQWLELVNRQGDADLAYRNSAHLFHALGLLIEILPDAVKPRSARTFCVERRVRGEK